MKVSRILESNSLKDFDQKDIHRFLNYGGVELYEESSMSSLARGLKLGDIKRGKYKATDVSKYLGGKGVSILFPANNREYSSKDYVFVGGTSDNFDKDFDIIAKVYDGIIEFPEGDFYAALSGILPKYHTPKSTWQYRFVQSGYNPPRPLISVPTNPKDWEEICKALTEFAVFLKLFSGCWFKIFIVPNKVESPYQKYFSNVTSLVSFIPSIINAGYNFIGYPLIMGKLAESMIKSNRGDVKPNLRDKILRFGERKYKDIYFVNLGTGSCFINPQHISDIEPIREIADSSRLRTMLDWILKGYEDNKYVIFYSDLDLGVAIAHEIGHYLIDKDGTLSKIQKGNKSGLLSDGFISFFGFLAGFLSSSVLEGGVGGAVAGWTEALATATGLLLKSPLLFSEYMASYRGLDVMREAGCSEEDIKMAWKFFKTAWGTYIASAAHTASSGPLWGRYIGAGIKYMFDKDLL